MIALTGFGGARRAVSATAMCAVMLAGSVAPPGAPSSPDQHRYEREEAERAQAQARERRQRAERGHAHSAIVASLERLEASVARLGAAEGRRAQGRLVPARTSTGGRVSLASLHTSSASDIACPVGRPREFSDTYGAARSGGRSHMGTDILAPIGTPVYAYESGTITRLDNNRFGGITLYLEGDSGATYYYAHMRGYVSGLSTGQRVSAGEQVGYNGDTGNAAGIPHLHVEVFPDGDRNTNPYPYVRRACD